MITRPKKSGWGGYRPNSGQKPRPDSKRLEIRLTEEQIKLLRKLGGSKWIQKQIESVWSAEMEIAARKLKEEERGAFVEGWTEAGGYTDDLDTPAPWCAPWTYDANIKVTGTDVKSWGAQYWEQCRKEIEALLAEEAQNADEK